MIVIDMVPGIFFLSKIMKLFTIDVILVSIGCEYKGADPLFFPICIGPLLFLNSMKMKSKEFIKLYKIFLTKAPDIAKIAHTCRIGKVNQFLKVFTESAKTPLCFKCFFTY